MKSKKAKLVSGVASPNASESLAGLFPDTHGKERPWRERPPSPQSTRRFRHPGTIWRCCSRPLLRRGRRELRIKGRIALVLETPRGRYGPVRQASPWAWASMRDLPRTYKVAQRNKRNGHSTGKRPKHVKAKNESKIAQAEFYIAMARK